MQTYTADDRMYYREIMLDTPGALNAGLSARFSELAGTECVRRTHFFGGRFENTYIDARDIPEIAPLISQVKELTAQFLRLESADLKVGFWFNVMEPGQRTLPHHHDENDELLSAVYYIRVPENSGDLILHLGGDCLRIRPQEGKLVMFAPAVVHEVTPNLSQELRLSVAFNVGPAEL